MVWTGPCQWIPKKRPINLLLHGGWGIDGETVRGKGHGWKDYVFDLPAHRRLLLDFDSLYDSMMYALSVRRFHSPSGSRRESGPTVLSRRHWDTGTRILDDMAADARDRLMLLRLFRDLFRAWSLALHAGRLSVVVDTTVAKLAERLRRFVPLGRRGSGSDPGVRDGTGLGVRRRGGEVSST